MQQLLDLITASALRPETAWSGSGLADIASRLIPDVVMGTRSTLLRGDAHGVWVRWFVESFFDIGRLEGATFARLYTMAVERLGELFATTPKDERAELARVLAQLARAEIRRREDIKRRKFDERERRRLLVAAGDTPRCWVCGYCFSEFAISKFMDGAVLGTPRLPLYVDYLLPHGANQRDLWIEVDHVVPISTGDVDDEDNLRLACGWCNGKKSGHISIYDVSATTKSFQHPRLGRCSVPQHFWVVRLLALRGRCEWQGGCTQTTRTTQLTVAPAYVGGAPNPVNLWICCRDHDPLGQHRLVPRGLFGGA